MTNNAEIEYATLSLGLVIRDYIENNMKKGDWELIAIDTKRGIVVLRRYNLSKKEGYL